MVVANNRVNQIMDAIEATNDALNCFLSTSQPLSLGQENTQPSLLSGVSFGVKDLFDVKGEVTRAGSKMLSNDVPKDSDALLVARLKAAGPGYFGRLNMDEFAYGFATVNSHYGTTSNPHDIERLAGGSSGGSAAAVAAGILDFALGSDTNGSIRVPASLCGVFGLRPTHGAWPMDGVFPFVEQFDTAGPFTRSIELMRRVYTVMSGESVGSHYLEKTSDKNIKVAPLGGWFRRGCSPDGLSGVDAIAAFFGNEKRVEYRAAEAARSAAFLITAYEGGKLHLDRLRTSAHLYDPEVKDRLIAGALLSEELISHANAVASKAARNLHLLLDEFDILIAPATPTVAPKITDNFIEIEGQKVSARANLGLYTQPLGPAGVPVLTVPLKRPGKLPLGVQLIAGRGKEAILFDAADLLVEAGVIGSGDDLIAENKELS